MTVAWAPEASKPSPVTHLKNDTPPNLFKYCHSLSNQTHEPVPAIPIPTCSWHVQQKLFSILFVLLYLLMRFINLGVALGVA